MPPTVHLLGSRAQPITWTDVLLYWTGLLPRPFAYRGKSQIGNNNQAAYVSFWSTFSY